jgi:5-(carboxyamino)imidazole ribonucleotide mutase
MVGSVTGECDAVKRYRLAAAIAFQLGLMRPLVAVIMGSKSDWETMSHAAEMLRRFEVPYDAQIVSAHRTPDRMAQFAKDAESRGVEVIIAGAGGAAHLPGMTAAHTVLPVLGVPVQSHALHGTDSLLSIAQMPAGIPVGTLAIGKAGAINAALLSVAILANSRPELRERLRRFRAEQTESVLKDRLPDQHDTSPQTPPGIIRT